MHRLSGRLLTFGIDCGDFFDGFGTVGGASFPLVSWETASDSFCRPQWVPLLRPDRTHTRTGDVHGHVQLYGRAMWDILLPSWVTTLSVPSESAEFDRFRKSHDGCSRFFRVRCRNRRDLHVPHARGQHFSLVHACPSGGRCLSPAPSKNACKVIASGAPFVGVEPSQDCYLPESRQRRWLAPHSSREKTTRNMPTPNVIALRNAPEYSTAPACTATVLALVAGSVPGHDPAAFRA